MRQLYIYLSFFLMATLAYGQSSNKNYIKSTTYTTESADPNSAIVGISYFDGLGRPEQQIQLKASTNGNSLVTKIEYDGFGRQIMEYLPVPYATNGEFVTPTSITGSHYQQNYAQSVWYSEKTIENSPLNRVMKQAAPGDDWAKDGGHEIEFEYKTNTANDRVWIYWVDTNGDIQKGNYSTVGNYYEEKTLYKTVTTDENGNKIYEFKDKYGRVVLKRSFVTELLTAGKPNPGEPPTTLSKQVDTYYVYDYFGNLLAVIPPLAAEKANMNSSIQNELCYLYKYDEKNRLVEKKLPGKGKEHMVYDKQNRLVATQDANLEAEGKWLFTKYDKFGRVVYTGVANNSSDRVALQTFVNNLGSNNEAKTVQPFQNNGIRVYYTQTAFPKSDFQVLTVNYYDDYNNFLPGSFVSIPTQVYDQSIRNGSNDSNNSLKGLPVASFVSTLPDGDWEQTFTFYDQKSRPVRTHKINHLYGYTKTDSKLNFTGIPEETTTEHKRDDTGEAVLLKDEFSYDHLLRLTKHTQSINGNPAKNLIAKNEYDAIGQLITKKVGGTQNGNDRWQEVNYKYNIRGWLTNINDIGIVLYGKDAMPPAADDDLFSFKINYNQLNNGGSQYAEPLYNGNIAQTLWRSGNDNVVRGYVYNYDELNRLLEAQFHKNDNNPFTGAYNESLAYDLNGNITSLNRTTGDTLGLPIDMDELTYSYKDGNGNSNLLLNVTDAVSNQNMGGFKDGNTNPNLNDYEYDLNGNMILDRNKGITEITYNHLNLPEKITFSNNDYIVYTYNAAGQKLSKYIFMVNTNNTIKTVEYLDGFQYTGGQLNFFPHPEGFVDVTLDINSQRVFNYVFNYTDHLGNIRLSYTKDMVSNELKIMEETHYYPFGLKHEVYTSPIVLTHKATPEPNIVKPGYALETEYQYKYNGKEWQDELGLNFYDYGWRSYMPDIARWLQSDPLLNDLKTTIDFSQEDEDNDEIDIFIAFSEKMKVGGGVYNPNNLNPYSYGYNNPVSFDDPDGRCPSCWGAFIGAAVEYGSQVAANLYEGKSLKVSMTDIDVGDVLVSAGEGALTGGVSAVKSVVAKSTIKVGSEVIKNTFDVKVNDGKPNVKVNDAKSVAKNTVIGLTVDGAGKAIPSTKVKVKPEVTPKQAVKAARTKGPVNRNQRIEIQNQAGKSLKDNKAINKTINGATGRAASGGTAETLKRKSDKNGY